LQALLEFLQDADVGPAVTSLVDEAVKLCYIGVDITPMHSELVQFLIRRELGVLVSVGPTEVDLEVVPKGPVHHGHACVFLGFEPESLVAGPGIYLGSVHVR